MAESDADLAARLQREELARARQAPQYPGGGQPQYQAPTGGDGIPTATVVALPQQQQRHPSTVYGDHGAQVGPGAGLSAQSIQNIYVIMSCRRSLMIFAIIDLIFGLFWGFGLSPILLITLMFPICALYSAYYVQSWGVWGYLFYQALQVGLQIYYMATFEQEVYQVIFSILNILISFYIGYLCWQFLQAVRTFTADIEATRRVVAQQAEEGFWGSVTYVPVQQHGNVTFGEGGGAGAPRAGPSGRAPGV